MDAEWDAIVIGAGHNGLVCASYLAKAGMSVLVLERSHRIGGACVTEELTPGCHFSTFAYVANGPGPKICADLGIAADAFEVVEGDPKLFLPFPDGEHIILWGDVDRTAASLSRFGVNEADGYRRYAEFMDLGRQIACDYFLRAPESAEQMAARYRGTPSAAVLDAMFNRSHWDVLCDFFQNDYVRCAMARADDVGRPTAVGSLLAEVIESANGGAGVDGKSGIAVGGMGAISGAIARAAQEQGVQIRTQETVSQVVVSSDEVIGVQLKSGEVLRARRVISNADPKRTFLQLVEEKDLEPSFRSQVANLKTRAGNMKFHAVLAGVPRFRALPAEFAGDARYVASTRISPSLAYFEEAWQDLLEGRPSRRPVMSLQLPTAYVPQMAPQGKHIFGAWIRYGPRVLAEGTWEERREEVTNSIVAILEEYAPGFGELVEWSRLYTPEDIERETGITDATIRHLDMTIDQMLHRRPLPPWSNYRTPLDGLWLCGSGTHPCGSVTGAPGHNAAHAILEDVAAGH